MGLKRIRIGGGGAAVEGYGVVGAALSVGDISGVEKSARVLRVIEEPGVEVGFRSLPVGLDDGGFSVGYLPGRGWGGGSCIGRRGSWRYFGGRVLKLGLGEAAKRPKKKNNM